MADKLSRLGQTIQTEWHQPQVHLFTTRFNNKLPRFVSPVPDSLAWAVDALSLSREDLNPYAFPLVEKLQGYPCNTMILIAPGWPNMLWFSDIVQPDPIVPALSANSAIQSDLSQESVKAESSYLVPKALNY